MNPVIVVQLLTSALADAAILLPVIQTLTATGQITVEQQTAVLAQYNSLKTQAEGQFAGPEWKLE